MADLASIDIGVEDDPSGAIADELEQKLVEVLRQNTPPSDARPLTLLARDARQAMIGGLIGSTSYGWLLVKMLWVVNRAVVQAAALIEQSKREVERSRGLLKGERTKVSSAPASA
jgi:hypothetical protein